MKFSVVSQKSTFLRIDMQCRLAGTRMFIETSESTTDILFNGGRYKQQASAERRPQYGQKWPQKRDAPRAWRRWGAAGISMTNMKSSSEAEQIKKKEVLLVLSLHEIPGVLISKMRKSPRRERREGFHAKKTKGVEEEIRPLRGHVMSVSGF